MPRAVADVSLPTSFYRSAIRDDPTTVGIESYEFRVVFKFSFFRRIIAIIFSTLRYPDYCKIKYYA
jgi:hypothetical protein